ncbi:CpXC domain-containing protein [Actomonas aquatica]|uniref:CpXC domain-containing protein n=1 Tax=Actomonas aquatica TaxID=2866162 RepID=A0ABZ1C377_9BACT|nr:CpXC domain-containing protein [Opitutus sp. WL0086]WRQ86157.1 CpXC domain-containing protein [Opitutus sp. WL0086]
MSQSAVTQISCPSCGHDQDFTLWNSINVGLDPDKKSALKNGSLTRFTCAKCAHETDVNYPILYHDPAHAFMVWLHVGEGEVDTDTLPGGEVLEGYHLRVVASRNALIEKTHVLEQGLDDRVMELFKALMRRDHNNVPEGELLFAGTGTGQQDVEELQFAVVAAGGTQFIGATRKAYDDYAAVLTRVADAEPLEVGKWYAVDQAYARQLIARHLPEAG